MLLVAVFTIQPSPTATGEDSERGGGSNFFFYFALVIIFYRERKGAHTNILSGPPSACQRYGPEPPPPHLAGGQMMAPIDGRTFWGEGGPDTPHPLPFWIRACEINCFQKSPFLHKGIIIGK